MDSTWYAATTNWVIFITIVIALASLWLFKKGNASNQKIGLSAFFLFANIAFLHWIFGGQHVLPADLSGPVFYAIILGGAAAVFTLLYFTFVTVFDHLSQIHLQLVQGIRVFIGGGFLMEGALGVIPAWFSIIDGFLHISSGFLALLAAIALLQKWKGNRRLLWLANGVGLADILIIITAICFWVWEDLGPFHNMNFVVFGIGPILLWLHYNSIKKLLNIRSIG